MEETIPIFTSHYSVGKSILTLEGPSDFNDGPDSIFSIAQKAGLKKVVLLDENCAGVFEAIKYAKNLDIQLIFGLKLLVKSNAEEHKVAIFAKNRQGVFDLFELFSSLNDPDGDVADEEDSVQEAILSESTLSELKMDNLELYIPFYDSYLFKNLFEFGTILPKFPKEPTYIIEDNGLPFDPVLGRKIKKIAKNSVKAKSIYYRNDEDFEAWQVYKMACAKQSGGKKKTLESPNMTWCGSNEFSWESYVRNS